MIKLGPWYISDVYSWTKLQPKEIFSNASLPDDTPPTPIRIILPLVLEENDRIKLDRIKLFRVLNKKNNSNSETRWLNSKFKQYGVVNKDLSTLLNYEELIVEQEKSYKLEKTLEKSDRLIIKLEGCDDRNFAEQLRNKEVYIHEEIYLH